MTSRGRGFLALLFTSMIFGTFGVWIRLLSTTFSEPGQVFARSFFATIFIVLILFFKKVSPFNVVKRNRKYIVLFSIVFPLSLLCFTFSANLIKVSNSLFMLYVGSLISSALLGRFIFKERFGLTHILSLVLVFFGLSFFVYPFTIESLSLGIVLGLAAGFLEGASHTLRKLMGELKREVVVFWQSFSGILVAAIFFLFSEAPLIREYNLTGILIAMMFGLLMVLIGYLLVYGFSNFDVNLGTLLLAAEMFFSLLVNSIVLKEVPTVYEFVGGVLIFSGTVLTTFNIKRTNKAT